MRSLLPQPSRDDVQFGGPLVVDADFDRRLTADRAVLTDRKI